MNDWFEAEQRLERAQQLCESHRWDEAVLEIEAAIALNPNNSSWHAQHGFLLDELERPEEAIDAFERAIELERGDRDVLMGLGVALARVGRLVRALEIFEEIGHRYPDFEPSYCFRIRVFAKLGRHEQAEEMFYQAQEFATDCPQCFYHVGMSLAARGKTERALFCFRRALELEPSFPSVNEQIAKVYRETGELEKAREYMLAELREAPGDTEVLLELAEIAVESGNPESAIDRLGQILELDPEHSAARFQLGEVLLATGEPARALECLEAARTELPERSYDIELRMGEAHLRLGQFRAARRCIEAALSEVADQPQALMLLGDALLADRKFADAANCFRKVLAQDNESATAHQCLAVCLIRTGRCEAGLDHFAEAIRCRPDYIQAIQNAVLAYLHLRRWSEARAMLERGLRVDPDNRILTLLKRRWLRVRAHYMLRRLLRPVRFLFRR
ncbi:MAG: tetratricopeptide repeat protein [Planctomycetes bacterium]|nr:tetratricopeptide repeat protein [Planctomycetota bacterium]